MKINREDVAAELRGYLRHEIALSELVDWAEQAMSDGEFEDEHFECNSRCRGQARPRRRQRIRPDMGRLRIAFKTPRLLGVCGRGERLK